LSFYLRRLLLREGLQRVYYVSLSSGVVLIEILGVYVISQSKCQSSLVVVKVPEGRSRLNTPSSSLEQNNDLL